MYPRWIIVLGLGSGFLLSGLLSGSHDLVHGTELPTAAGLVNASTSPLPRASGAPSKPGVTPRSGRAAAPQAIGARLTQSALPWEEDEDEDEAKAEEEAARRFAEEKFRKVSVEARDEAWAAAMEASVASALEQVIAAAPIAVGKLDCRTEHCQFEIEWSDRDAARGGASDMLAMLPGECARLMTHIDDEQDEYDLYKSRVLLMCPRAELQR